jgi:hypothetical protein
MGMWCRFTFFDWKGTIVDDADRIKERVQQSQERSNADKPKHRNDEAERIAQAIERKIRPLSHPDPAKGRP